MQSALKNRGPFDWRLPVCVLLCALLWGSAFPTIKSVYANWEANSLSLRLVFAGVRFLLAGAIILPFCGAPFRQLREGNHLLLLAMALTQTFLQYLLFYSGLAISSGVLGALLVGSGSFWWVLLAPLLLKTPYPTWRHWMTLGLGALGIVLAVYAPRAGGTSPIRGSLCFLGSTLGGALGAITVVPLSRSISTRAATAFSLLMGGAMLAMCGMAGWSGFLHLLDPALAIKTLYLSIVSASAFCLWNWLIKQYSVNILAGYRFLIPLSGMILSSLFIEGEKSDVGLWIGGLLVLGSLVLLSRIEKESLPTARPRRATERRLARHVCAHPRRN